MTMFDVLLVSTFVLSMVLSAIVGYVYGVRSTMVYYNTLLKQITAKSTNRFEADFNEIGSKSTH